MIDRIKEYFGVMSTIELDIDAPRKRELLRYGVDLIRDMQSLLGKSFTKQLLKKYYKGYNNKRDSIRNVAANHLLNRIIDTNGR